MMGIFNQDSDNVVVKKKSIREDLAKKNLKLCPACNRRIPIDAIQCNFCKTKFTRGNKNLKNKEKADKEKHDKLLEEKQGLKICPNCGKPILKNAIRCKYCKTMLKSYSDVYSLDNTKSFIDENKRDHDILLEEKQGLKICPYCGKLVLKNAVRCKYCKAMLKSYSADNSSDVGTYSSNKLDSDNNKNTVPENSSDCTEILNDDLKKKIEYNIDDVCRIFSIPNLGKKFVINKLTSNFTQEEIAYKLNEYLDNSPKFDISSRLAHKKGFMETNIKPIPDEHFKVYFIIHNSQFKSKDKFIDYIQAYWSINKINKFYEEYTSLLKNGIQKEHFEKILENDIKETCEIFSVNHSLRKLGDRFIVNRILNNNNEYEIKQKLNSYFKLSEEYINKDSTNNIDVKHENKDTKSPLSSKPKHYNYKVQVDSLKSKFTKKEQSLRQLIEKCFPGPQMTNAKFNAIVDECSRVFSLKEECIMMMVESTDEYSDKLDKEINSDLEILKGINIKLNSLQDELLIVQSDKGDDDVDLLFDEMDDLIGTVKEYKYD